MQAMRQAMIVFGALPWLVATAPAGHRGLKRTGATPDVPTMNEAGVPGFDVISWFGLVAPAAVPKPIIERLYRETDAVLRSTREAFPSNDIEMASSTPDELGERIRSEMQTWTKVIREARIKPD